MKANSFILHTILLRVFDTRGSTTQIFNLESSTAILPVFLGSVLCFTLCRVQSNRFSPSMNLTVCLLITQQRCFASDEGTHSFVLPHKCWAWRCPSQSLTQVSLPDSSPGNLQEFASKRRASIQRVPLRQAALLYTSSGRIQDLIRGLL